MKGPKMRAVTIMRMGLAGAALGLASACISIGGGGDPPPSLFSLTPAASAAAGSSATGTSADALSVVDPQAPARLNVLRVPVQVSDSSIAYLQDAQWVERPARLFGRLLAETIRAGGNRLVVEGSDVENTAATRLSGQLLEMGYVGASQSVLVRYDAILQMPDGEIRTRRFEASVAGVPADPDFVGPALNEAANQVAGEVAEWVG